METKSEEKSPHDEHDENPRAYACETRRLLEELGAAVAPILAAGAGAAVVAGIKAARAKKGKSK